MPLTTPNGIIQLSLKNAGVLGVGQTALAEDANDAFDVVNAMMSQWNRKRWLVWHLVDTAIVSTGAQSYTVGPGGDLNIPRPDRIESAFFRQISIQPLAPDYPMELIEARETYNRICLKKLTAFPQYLFYDSAYPLGSVYPWPIPTANIYELHITTKDVIAQFTSLAQTINLPPEYQMALMYNLSVRMQIQYNLPTNPSLVALAKDSLNVITGANAQIARLVMPDGLVRSGSGYNIYSDQVN